MNSRRPHALPGARGPNSWNKIPPVGGIFANTLNACPFSSRSPHTKTESARSQHSPAHLCRHCAFLQGSSRHDAVPNRMAVIEYLASATPSDSYEGIAMTYSDIVEDGTTETEEQEYLVSGDMGAIMIVIPRNRCAAGEEAVAFKGVSFNTFVQCA